MIRALRSEIAACGRYGVDKTTLEEIDGLAEQLEVANPMARDDIAERMLEMAQGHGMLLRLLADNLPAILAGKPRKGR